MEQALLQYDHLKQDAYTQLLTVWPRFDNYNHFEIFVILNLLIIATYLVFSFISSFSLKSFYSKFMRLVFDLPPIRKYILTEVEKARKEVLKDHPKELLVSIKTVPYKSPNI